jgi:hypothetical protein
MKSPLVRTPVMNVLTSACISTLCTVAAMATKYNDPITANGTHERIARFVIAEFGAAIMAPYRGRTATVPIEKTVSGRALGTTRLRRVR